jgi:hypothetical protein
MEKREVGFIPESYPVVAVTVTRRGHGQISTGVHDKVTGDELYAKGEKFSVAENIALELEDRGFVTVDDAEPDDVSLPEKRGPGRPPKAA